MTEIPLPTLHEGTLDPAQVRALSSDLSACAEHLEVLPKGGARAYAAEVAPSLDEAIDALLRGELYGLQLRYLHAGQEWCDTLLPSRGGGHDALSRSRSEQDGGVRGEASREPHRRFRLVRMQQG